VTGENEKSIHRPSVAVGRTREKGTRPGGKRKGKTFYADSQVGRGRERVRKVSKFVQGVDLNRRKKRDGGEKGRKKTKFKDP